MRVRQQRGQCGDGLPGAIDGQLFARDGFLRGRGVGLEHGDELALFFARQFLVIGSNEIRVEGDEGEAGREEHPERALK